jgi:putative DNA primase/helicase
MTPLGDAAGTPGLKSRGAEITVFQKSGGPLSKKIHLVNGKLSNDDSACSMLRGSARRVPLDLANMAAFAGLISSFSSREAYAIGRLKPGLPDCVPIVTQNRLGEAQKTEPSTIARSLDFLGFAKGEPGVALIDIDLKGMAPAVSARIGEAGGYWAALCSVARGLASAARVERASTSTGLRNKVTGETYPASGGFHCAVAVADSADVPRFLPDFHDRLWLAGYGWGMGSAAGSFLERSLVDKACASPERLIFEGQPIVEEPLEQAPRPAIAHEGAILDTLTACPPLDATERLRLKTLKEAERLRLQPELDALREKWSETHVKRMVEKGATEAEARGAVARWIDRKELTGDFPLPFDDPDLAGASVADVLAAPKKYLEKTLADPFEGPTYGRGKAIVYRRPDGSLIVNSFAHGGAVYELKPLDEGAGFEDAPPPFSDEGLALRFVKKHAGELRFVAARNNWLSWNGVRWQDEKTLYAFDLARHVCREAIAEGAKAKAALSVASAKTVAAVERLARADRRVSATAEQWDRDRWLLNTPDGVVDLRTGNLRPHDRLDYMTKITAVGPRGDCPIFKAFLNRITSAKLATYLQRVFGYCLSGDTSEQAMFFGYGEGQNGKGVLLQTAGNVLGDYCKTAAIETFTESKTDRHPTELARLQKARLVTASETEAGRQWAESRLKLLTGSDTVTAHFMRQDDFEYTPEFKLFFSGNHKPGLRNVGKAMRRRMNMIPFLVTIPEAEVDKHFADKLKPEWPGILAWMVEGCLEWQKRGLEPPESVTQATDDYFAAQDSFSTWLQECCERDPNAWTGSTPLFASWKTWAEKTGIRHGNIKEFSDAMDLAGFARKPTKTGKGYEGLRLAVEWPAHGQGDRDWEVR